MAKTKRLKKTHRPERAEDQPGDAAADPSLVRRMSASSDGLRSEASEPGKDDLVETYRSVSEVTKRRRRPKIWNIFDWSFKNVSYERMSTENKRRLVFYKVLSYIALALLIVGYGFFIGVFFKYLIYIEEGEIVDEELFTPVKETLLHTLVTLWKQRAYFVVGVVSFFSISLPFIKLVAAILCYAATARHRRKQIHLFYGQRARPARGRGEAEQGSESSELDDYAIYEDGRLIKYAREVLVILRLISKFQMVDVIILLTNISFLRSAFIWAKAEDGLLYLFVYCVFSIFGAQLLNVAVDGEREIFEYWRAVHFLYRPAVASYYSNRAGSLAVGGGAGPQGPELAKGGSGLNATSAAEPAKAASLELHGDLSTLANIKIQENPSVFNIMSRTSGLDVMSNATSEVDYYELLYTNKKSMKVRWYRSEVFVGILVALNVVSAILIVTREKMFGITFTPDTEKAFGVDGAQMSFFEIINSLRDCWKGLPLFVFFVVSIAMPVAYHVSFLAGLLLYGVCVRNRDCGELGSFDPSRPKRRPGRCLKKSVWLTKFLFNLGTLLSEWSTGEVLALGLLAGYVSLSTASNVRFYIPPKKIYSPFALVGTFGITSFLINIQFFMWHTRIVARLSDVTIYIESLNSNRSLTGSREGSGNLNVVSEGSAVSVPKGSGSSLQRLESYAEANEGDIMHQPEQGAAAGRGTAFKRWLFKFIDIVRHFVYSKLVVSIFFAVFSLIALYFFVISFVMKQRPTPVDEVKIGHFLKYGVPELVRILKRNMPASAGDCFNKYPPTQPCVGNSPLLTYKQAVGFELVWITGLNTINIVDSKFYISDDRRLNLRLHVKFSGLRPFLKVFSFIEGNFTTFFSGDHMCCGDDVHFLALVSTSCSEALPYFRDIKMEQIKISNLKFKNELFMLVEHLVKLQRMVEARLLVYINDFLDKQDDVMQWRGVDFSVVGFINYLLTLNFPAGITCALKASEKTPVT